MPANVMQFTIKQHILKNIFSIILSRHTEKNSYPYFKSKMVAVIRYILLAVSGVLFVIIQHHKFHTAILFPSYFRIIICYRIFRP